MILRQALRQTTPASKSGPQVDPRPRLVESLRGIAKRFRQQARRMRAVDRDYARAAADECTKWAAEIVAQERAERVEAGSVHGNPSRLGA